MHESEKWKWSRSVVSDPQWPHGLQPSMLLCPWDYPGKSTGVGCHCLLCCILRPLLNLLRVFLNIFLIIFDYQQFHGQLWIERLNCVPDFIFPTNIHVYRKAYINTCFYIYICMCAQVLHCVQLFATLWLQPTRLLCPWDSKDENTGVGCHAPGDLPNPGVKPASLHCRQILYLWATRESHIYIFYFL